MLEWLINTVRRMWLEAELSALENNALLLQCEMVDAPKKLDELHAQILLTERKLAGLGGRAAA
jgi:hypothetical protein